MAKNGHCVELSVLEKELNTSFQTGLTASQVEKNREKYGVNEMETEPPTPLWVLVLKQFEDVLVLILIGAAFISFVLAFFEEGEDVTTAFVEPFVIILILVANATVGVLQESSAEAAVEALKVYESPHAAVYREGRLCNLAATELVVGDLVELSAGDLVPADIRMVQRMSSSFDVAQELLTGESKNVEKRVAVVAKDAQLQDKVNVLFSGSTCTRGKCAGVVISVGNDTEKGKIGRALSEESDTETPLKKKLDEFGFYLSIAIGIICVIVWLINIGHFSDPAFGGTWKGAMYYFKIAVSLAVAAIPEGLPAVVTTCLALGTQRMAKKNAIVTVLTAVETLGCTNVICSDKTGTLTTNQMSVQALFVLGDGGRIVKLDVEGDTYAPAKPDGSAFHVQEGSHILQNPASDYAGLSKAALISALCNQSSISYNSEVQRYEKVGQSTESAMKVLVEKLGVPDGSDFSKLSKTERSMACSHYWEARYESLVTLEFDRDRKSMGQLVRERDSGNNVLLVKGAWDNVLNRCSNVYISETERAPLDADMRQRLAAQIEEYCSGRNSYRCLAMAFRDNLPFSAEELSMAKSETFAEYESDMTFVGVVGILDPPRKEVKAAIEKCKTAGINVIMITGDNKATAIAICRKIGILDEDEDATGKCWTGAEFKKMTPEERHNNVLRARVFARVEPIDKKELVAVLHGHNKVVAMTGDGVNDAPALKAANIGLAMGSGTAVAKGAAEMVLADDNFTTIVAAIEEGRNIYNNTKQFIRYLITANIGEVVAIFITAVTGLPEVLLPVQLLWVNLVTDGLPAVALGFNRGEEGIMEQAPRPNDEPIVGGFTFIRYLITGVYIGIATVGGAVWWYTWYENGPHVPYDELFEWARCDPAVDTVSCDVFKDHTPGTIALTILVTIEMFCALNSLSEKQSMFSPYGHPGTNLYLLVAMSISFGLHFVILYVPFFAKIFSVVPINLECWFMVIALSFPAILIDEVMKFVVRKREAADLAARLEARKNE